MTDWPVVCAVFTQLVRLWLILVAKMLCLLQICVACYGLYDAAYRYRKHTLK
jgi:hypothetical protein